MFAGSRLLLPVLRTVLHWCRNPGTRCQRALAAEGDHGAECLIGGGAGAIEDQVGRKARCRAPGSRRGGCRPRGSGGVGAVRQEAGACCRPPCWGRSRERGLAAGCPQTGGAIAVRQEAERRAVHQRMSSTIAWHREWEPRSWLRTERQCVGEPDREIFFSFSSLPSLVSVSPHPSVSFSLASSVLTPRYTTAAVIGSPQRGGRGE